jgi:mannosyltransferase
MTLVVHPHIHPRRTGVTTHTESIVTALAPHVEAKVWGRTVDPALPHISIPEVLRRAKTEDVIWHAHRNNELLLGHSLKLLRPRLKLVYTRHGSYAPSAFTVQVARTADAVVTLNQGAHQSFKVPSTLVPHGLDLKRMHPPSGARKEAWAKLGLGGTYGVGVIGRVRPNKGQGDFVAAIAPLLAELPEWKPVLVGAARGSHEAWAKTLVEQTGGKLTLAGEHKDSVPWFQGLTILVNASHGESFGLTILEGMAAGCCVIASKLPHVPELIEHGRTGFLYEPKDVNGLRALLAELMRDPARAAAIGKAAAEECVQRFDVAREARQLAELYAQVLSGARR